MSNCEGLVLLLAEDLYFEPWEAMMVGAMGTVGKAVLKQIVLSEERRREREDRRVRSRMLLCPYAWICQLFKDVMRWWALTLHHGSSPPAPEPLSLNTDSFHQTFSKQPPSTLSSVSVLKSCETLTVHGYEDDVPL